MARVEQQIQELEVSPVVSKASYRTRFPHNFFLNKFILSGRESERTEKEEEESDQRTAYSTREDETENDFAW